MVSDKLYWEDKDEEEKSIKEAAFVSAIIDLGVMWRDDIRSGKIKPKDYPLENSFFRPKKKVKRVIPKRKGYARRLIDGKLKISEVAEIYGFKVKKGMMICPFHNDTDPSLSLNDTKNVFFCFGCNATGDIVEFIRGLMKWKNQQEKKQ